VEALLERYSVYGDFFKDRDLCIYVLEDNHMGGNTYVAESRFVDDMKQRFWRRAERCPSGPT